MPKCEKLTEICLIVLTSILFLAACRNKGAGGAAEDLPDINALMRTYVTTADLRVKSGPGPEFRTLAQIPRNAKVQVVGRDGDWVLIVSKRGNAPGFIELASVAPSSGEETPVEATKVKVEGQFVTLTDTQVRSGPGLHYPVVANIPKGIKLNVVAEEHGWLRVESKQGNKPGYVDASLAQAGSGR